ncbi:MAG TPA: O-antigen ligase family protein, partial [Vicinamibacterales bacterium]|nr:O-antigen ligase family protein [Vicinamibacterales bacterium]
WLLVFTLVLFLRPQDLFPPLAVLHLAEVSALVGLFSLFMGRMRRREPVTRMTAEFAGVLAFGAIILATAPFSLWFGGSFGVFTDLYAKVILIYLLAVNAVASPKRLERLTWVLVLSVGYVGFRAVLDYARGVNLIARGTRVQGSVGGIMQNPNDLALNMVAFVPLAVFFALSARTPWRRLIAAACALFMAGAVVASGSRGGFVGFLAMVLVLAVMQVRRRPAVIIAGVLAALCALPLLPASYWRRIASITDHSKDDYGSADARETLMGESLQAYMENPVIGVGAGEFKDWNPGHRIEAWHESHNVWLQVAAELGTLGLAAFFFLVARAFVAVFQTRRLLRRAAGGRHGEPPAGDPAELALLDAHAAAMMASLAGWFVCAFFASVAYNWTFYYLLALAATPRDILKARIPQTARTRRAWAAGAPKPAIAGRPGVGA